MKNINKLTIIDYSLNFNMYDIYNGQKYPRINIHVKELPFNVEMIFEDIKKNLINNDSYTVFLRYGQNKKAVGIIKHSDIMKIYNNIEKYELNFPWSL